MSKADQLADDAAALTPLQGTSAVLTPLQGTSAAKATVVKPSVVTAAKATVAKPSGQDEPMEQPAGTAWLRPHIQSCCLSGQTAASQLYVTSEHGILILFLYNFCCCVVTLYFSIILFFPILFFVFVVFLCKGIQPVSFSIKQRFFEVFFNLKEHKHGFLNKKNNFV